MNIFDHIKNITTNKGPYLGDEGWNNYMVNRFLSMDPDFCEVVNYIQKNTWQMKGEHLYNLYKDLIPKQYKYLKYIKAKNKKEYDLQQVEAVALYFEVSKKQAKEYIDMLPKEEIENINKTFDNEYNALSKKGLLPALNTEEGAKINQEISLIGATYGQTSITKSYELWKKIPKSEGGGLEYVPPVKAKLNAQKEAAGKVSSPKGGNVKVS